MHLAKYNERKIKSLKGKKRKSLICFLARREAKIISDFFKQFKNGDNHE
jgi:hypothetical protein